MTVNTGISTSLRRPQTFHTFTYLQGGRALVPLPQKLCLIGTMKGGTAVAGTLYQINDPVETDGLFGVGSQLALMCRQAFMTSGLLGQGPQLSAIGVAEPAGGAQHTQTFTVTGPATASGNVVIRIAGRTLTIGVASGDSASTIAAAINAAIGALATTLPVTSVVLAGVVTCTHVVKGVGGNDVLYEVTKVPAGVAIVTAQGVAGSGISDETAALAAIAGVEFDAIALENHLAADVALALSHVTVAWTATEKKWRWVFIGEPGTIGTATTLAAAANDRAIVVVNCNGCRSLPAEMATSGAVALLSRSRPNGNWDGMVLPLYPPDDAVAYTAGQIETALAAGLTPLKSVEDPNSRVTQQGVLKISKLVTTCTTVASQPFEGLRDIAVPRVGAFIARQIDAAHAARFSAAANPDGALDTPDSVNQVRDMIANLLYAAQDGKIVKNVDNDLQALVVEDDPSAPGRVNADIQYTVVLGLHQVACVHRVTVG
jgi:phage tail sheath gpL-like